MIITATDEPYNNHTVISEKDIYEIRVKRKDLYRLVDKEFGFFKMIKDEIL